MYESFFHFSRRPFSAAPDPECYFPASSTEQARLTLTRCIDRGAGPALLIGSSGLGKTLLCQVLARHFAGRFAVAVLANARLSTPRALLQAILFELGLPFRDMGEGELRLSLIDHVAPSRGGVQGMLLVVDEAHCLSPRLLEEIRMITNLVRDGQLRVRVVLSGGARLEERFASPKLESFNQRIAARCYLEPLNHDETCNFVRAQLTAAGAAPHSIFTEDALTALHRAGDGIPRLINQVADHALLLAAAGGQPIIDTDGINEAWSDLQQLPSVLGSESEVVRDESGGGVVEFGSLSDDEGRSAAAVSSPTALALGHPSDPSERLDRIERHMAEAQRDLWAEEPTTAPQLQFDPQASLRPEVELVFDEAEDPFAEEFEEEELIEVRAAPFRNHPPRPDRRQSAMAAGNAVAANGVFELESPVDDESLSEPEPYAGAEPPTVVEQEDTPHPDDRQNADKQTGFSQSLANEPASSRFAVVSDPDDDPQEDTELAETDDPAETPGSDEQDSDDVEALPDDRSHRSRGAKVTLPYQNVRLRYSEATVAMAGGPFVVEQEAAAVTVIPLTLWTESVAESVPADDRDIIVVDDRVAARAEVEARPRPGRRHDYRRLFAQLRQREA